MADLQIASLAARPDSPAPGEQAQILVEIHNRADVAASNVELVVFANGELVETRKVSIAAYAADTVGVPWTPNSAGVQILSAVVDPNQTLTELDRADNSATLDVAVANAAPAQADFVVVSAEIIAKENSPRVLRIVIRNDGPVEATAPIIIRRNGKIAASVLPPPLNPGQQQTIDVPWSDPEGGRIQVEINPRNMRQEPRSNNNTMEFDPRSGRLSSSSSTQLAAAAQPPSDLRIEDVSLQTAHLEEGQERRVALSFRIVNAGGAITKSFRTRIEPSVTEGGERAFFVTTSAMPAGGVLYVSHMIERAAADFTLTIEGDADKAIGEANEENNIATAEFHNPSPDVDRWVSIGPRRITNSSAHGYGWTDAVGRLSAIAIHPNQPNTIYVGAQLSGVWKTTDGGQHWEPIAEAATLRIAALSLEPGNPSRVYLVTPDDGVFRSDDDGTSWQQISTQDLDAQVYNGGLLINPGNRRDMLVASKQGVYRSLDGGMTWQLTLSGSQATGLVYLPSNPRTVFAALTHNSDANANIVGDPSIAGIYRSNDSGGTWRAIKGCPGGTLPAGDADTLIRLAASGRQLFASYRLNTKPKKYKLFRTTNLSCLVGGLSDSTFEAGWQPTGTSNDEPIPQVLWSGLWAHPTNPQILFAGGSYLWKSTNNGGSFSAVSGMTTSGSAHMDHQALGFDPQSPDTIYSLNDGGIYRSMSGGSSGSWKFIGEGITNVEFYDHVSAPTEPSLVIGGTQDNGNIRAKVGDSVWRMVGGGDGATVDIDWTDPDVLYAMGQYAGSIARSSNGGSSFGGAASGLPTGTVCQNLHFQTHPRIPTTLLAACEGLWRSTNSGGSWTKIFTPPVGKVVKTAIDGPADVYLVGTSSGAMYRSSSISPFSATAFGNPAFQHPASMGVSDIEIDLDDRAIVYASFGGGGPRRVYRLAWSAASSSFMGKDITSDLPIGRPVKTIAVDRNRPFTVYAGTDRGVFRGRSLDGGTTWFWLPYANGLPSTADIRDLEVHPATGVMRAATHGRSAFEVNTDDPVGSLLAISGRLTFLRVHDVETGFGPPPERMDAEVVAKVDSEPTKAFGFQLRANASEADHQGMLDALRNALRRNQPIRLEYVKTSIHHGTITRVVRMQ